MNTLLLSHSGGMYSSKVKTVGVKNIQYIIQLIYNNNKFQGTGSSVTHYRLDFYYQINKLLPILCWPDRLVKL